MPPTFISINRSATIEIMSRKISASGVYSTIQVHHHLDTIPKPNCVVRITPRDD